jgi:hypothetical protein
MSQEEKPTIISKSDLVLFKQAQLKFASAKEVMDFVEGHMGQTYQLQNGESFDLGTGLIKRNPTLPPAPPQGAPDGQ